MLRIPVVLALTLGMGWPNIGAASTTDEIRDASRLYSKGRRRFDQQNYVGAIQMWISAYSRLKRSDETRKMRSALIYNIAIARIEAFKVDGNTEHLEHARTLLKKYIVEVGAREGVSFEAAEEFAEYNKKINEIYDALAEADGVITADIFDEPYNEALPPGSTMLEAPDAANRWSTSRPLRIAGIITTSLGGGLAVISFVGMGLTGSAGASSIDPEVNARSQKKMAGMAVGAGIGALVLIGTGVAFLVADARKHRAPTNGDLARRIRWTGPLEVRF